MAVAFKIGVLYLVSEFLAHTFEILGALKSAGTISARALKSLLHGIDDLGIFVKSYLHRIIYAPR